MGAYRLGARLERVFSCVATITTWLYVTTPVRMPLSPAAPLAENSEVGGQRIRKVTSPLCTVKDTTNGCQPTIHELHRRWFGCWQLSEYFQTPNTHCGNFLAQAFVIYHQVRPA